MVWKCVCQEQNKAGSGGQPGGQNFWYQTTAAVLSLSALRRKAVQIRQDSTHPLNSAFETLPSGRRLRMPLARKKLLEEIFCSVSHKHIEF